jgi:hypothetical protein
MKVAITSVTLELLTELLQIDGEIAGILPPTENDMLLGTVRLLIRGGSAPEHIEGGAAKVVDLEAITKTSTAHSDFRSP